ncbi:MAG: bifunctional 5,10-methylenetetrahydrofolate dehydrogenase/5,10-methenyltetrahydrofolate cyclohydrolase, partial [Thermoanaerobaculia bacterium]
LAVVLVGDDPASKVYVATKTEAAARAGLANESAILPSTASAGEVAAALDGFARRDDVDGILLQLPLPAGLQERELVARIPPEKDVDGLHPLNVGRLWSDEPGPLPCTPAGILELLRRSAVPLAGCRAVVVGRSRLVGRPLAGLLLREHATVTLCHSRTRELAALTRQADLLVAAVGRPALIGPEHVADGATVIDVGINRVTERALVERLFPGDRERLDTLERRGAVLVGDVDYTRVAPRAAAITPVPGGVGPLTVAMLLANTLAAARRRQGRR